MHAIPFLKRFTVFNVAQCDGLPERFTAEPSLTTDYKPHQAADELIVACEADFRIGGSEAYYSPIGDFVQADDGIFDDGDKSIPVAYYLQPPSTGREDLLRTFWAAPKSHARLADPKSWPCPSPTPNITSL
ncbi:MAG: hypothetical protein HC793_00655, partial [Aquincola sp.]|nr:hypothetical protein [Aquincola sp.]